MSYVFPREQHLVSDALWSRENPDVRSRPTVHGSDLLYFQEFPIFTSEDVQRLKRDIGEEFRKFKRSATELVTVQPMPDGVPLVYDKDWREP